MIQKTFSSFVNHLLRQHLWARERLAAHAGGRIRLRMAPVFTAPLLTDIDLLILASGLIEPCISEAAPDLLVAIKPAAIPMLLVHHPDALKRVALSGNAALASAVQELVSRLEWDVEEDLSRIVGDIAAHRIAAAGKDLFSWQRDALERSARNFAEYWTEENPMLARRAEIDRFARDLQALEQSLALVELRLQALIDLACESAP
ncbi:MAG: hypothetical protein EXR28_02150 [Betaproteobacteria bacterium]|nr:hypothetical protein [Betaproteobacteria bacterium]